MKQYRIYTFDVSHPQLGSIVVDLDESQGTGAGWWRQRVKFNGRLLPGAVGKWVSSTMWGNKVELYSETFGPFTDPYITLNDAEVSRRSIKGTRGDGTCHFRPDPKVRWRLRNIQIIQEMTIQDIAGNLVDTTWRFVSSEGKNASAGGVFGISYNLGAFYVKGDSEAKGKQHKILYSSAGFSLGKSATPISFSGSTSSMLSGGIGKIYTTKKQMSLLDFEGPCTIIEVSGIASIREFSLGAISVNIKGQDISGAGLYAIFFHQDPFLFVDYTAIEYTTKAVGFMYGTVQGIGAGVGTSLTTGTAVIMG